MSFQLAFKMISGSSRAAACSRECPRRSNRAGGPWNAWPRGVVLFVFGLMAFSNRLAIRALQQPVSAKRGPCDCSSAVHGFSSRPVRLMFRRGGAPLPGDGLGGRGVPDILLRLQEEKTHTHTHPQSELRCRESRREEKRWRQAELRDLCETLPEGPQKCLFIRRLRPPRKKPVFKLDEDGMVQR